MLVILEQLEPQLIFRRDIKFEDAFKAFPFFIHKSSVLHNAGSKPISRKNGGLSQMTPADCKQHAALSPEDAELSILQCFGDLQRARQSGIDDFDRPNRVGGRKSKREMQPHLERRAHGDNKLGMRQRPCDPVMTFDQE